MSQADRIRRYKRLVEKRTPGSHMVRDCLRAFWVGGLICMIGQAITLFGAEVLKLNLMALNVFTPSVLVFLATTLTGLGVYDRIGEYAGGGSIVPITGFANSVAAPALEFKSEGIITGMSAKMFVIAGPVIVFGISASVIYGIIYCLVT